MERSDWQWAGLALCGGAVTIGAGYVLSRKLLGASEKNNTRRKRFSEYERLDGFEDDSDVNLNLNPERESKDHAPIYTVVLTGGPCAGKTTALARISTFLAKRGFRVFTVPEAATMLFSNGAEFGDLNCEDNLITFQGNLLMTQIHLEDTFVELAKNTRQPSVILCDRGTMDGSVYIEPATWGKLLDAYGFDVVKLRDERYNAVFHLVTAADGAESFYSLENNAARTETVEEAQVIDAKLRQAWVGHSNLIIFENGEGGFEDKLQKVISGVGQLVGLPDCQRHSRKFLMRVLPESLPCKHEIFFAEKVYLKTPSEKKGREADYCFVRKRSQGTRTSHQLTQVTFDKDGNKIEVKRIIRKRTYRMAVNVQADPARKVVRQRRLTFLWGAQYFEIYDYQDANILLLICQVEKGHEVKLPPFLDIEREVTGANEYSAYKLSLKEVMETTGLGGLSRAWSGGSDKEGKTEKKAWL